MAEFNFTAITPTQMDAFLKASIKQKAGWATTDLSNPLLQPPIVRMTVSPSDNSDRKFEFTSPSFVSYLDQAERMQNGITKTAIMLYVVNVETPDKYNYCDLLVFDHRWGVATHYGTNFYTPFKKCVSTWCDSVSYDYRNGTLSELHNRAQDRVPIIHGTSLFAAHILYDLIQFDLKDFPSTIELYYFGLEHFPESMPVASDVFKNMVLPSYVNRHRSPELERFDFNIRIPGFYEGCRMVPDKDPNWDCSYDGRRNESWRRYKYVLQVWNVNGERKYLVKAEKAKTNDPIIVDYPRSEEVSDDITNDVISEVPPPPYKIRRDVYYPRSSSNDFLPDPDFNLFNDGHFSESYTRSIRFRHDSSNDASDDDEEDVNLNLNTELSVRLNKAHQRYHHSQLPIEGENGASLVLQEDADQCDIDDDIPYLHPMAADDVPVADRVEADDDDDDIGYKSE